MYINYNKNIYESFEEQVEKNPDKTAIIFGKKTWTYQELNKRSNLIANNILDMKIKPKGIVAIYMERNAYFVSSILGIMKSGNAYLPINPEHPIDRTNSILENVNPNLIITQSALKENLPSKYHLFIPNTNLSESDKEKQRNLELKIDSKDLAYIIFTSGSAGNPKGVMIPHKALNNFIYSMTVKPGITKNDRLLAVTTFTFDISILEILLPLANGASFILLDTEGIRDPSKIIGMLEKYQCTFMQATPSTWQMLVDYGWKGDPHIKALCGGEALPSVLAKELLKRSRELWNMYGPTETTIWSTIEKVKNEKEISIGSPIHNTEIFILNEKMQQVPSGEIGDLFIGGVGLADGYYNQLDLTAKTFVTNPLNTSERIYKTGDLARFISDGRIECLGRSDLQVKIRGFRIELGEIENTLIKMDGIKAALVHLQNIYKDQKDLVAYVIPEDSAVEYFSIRKFLSYKLPHYMIPAFSINIVRFPLNSNGKIDRKALPVPQLSTFAKGSEKFSKNMDLEEKLKQIWRNILHQESSNIKDDFFDWGGNSILAVQFVSEVNMRCGTNIALGTFFKYSNIAELIDLIEGKLENKIEMVIPLQKDGDELPLFCIGGIELYSELAESLGTTRPVYGVFLPYEQQLIEHIQNKTLDKWDYLTIEGMASSYLIEIKKNQSKGPYNLLGVSIAGLIVFEIARQLKLNNEDVRSLILLDSHLPSGLVQGLSSKIIRFIKYVKQALINLLQKLKIKGGKNKLLLDNIAEIRDRINSKAIKEYDRLRPSYDGDVCLIRATDNSYPLGVSYLHDLGWKKLITKKLDIFDVHGSHLEILKDPNVNFLANNISTYLDERDLD